MKLSRLIPIALITLGVASISFAQSAGPSGGKLAPSPSAKGGRHPLLDAIAKLNLTPDQKSKIKALEETRKEDVKAFRKAHKGDQTAIKAFVKDETQKFLTGVKGVLTPAQWDQLQTELQSLRGRRKNKAAPPNPTTLF